MGGLTGAVAAIVRMLKELALWWLERKRGPAR